MRLAALAVLLTALPVSAQNLDDSDLSGPKRAPAVIREGRPEQGLRIFSLQARPGIKSAPTPEKVTALLRLADRKGVLAPARQSRAMLVGPGAPSGWTAADAEGRLTLPLPAGLSGSFRLRFSLDNARWTVKDKNGAAYEWESPAFTLPAPSGVDLGALSPEAGTQNAKLAILHLTYLRAFDFLARQGDLAWWDQTLTINWPGSSDYFSPWSFSLELTDAEHWDVILHELGHAVMHKSMKAQSAGGQHKIDECYSPALAWSEGWATFFAAAVALERDDADAKFEFLVPRRSPIRIENVPEDVCRGQSNEWRVAAGMWDLYDSHSDGSDNAVLEFQKLWTPLRGASMGSLADAWGLIAKGLNSADRRAGETSLAGNSLLAPPSELRADMPVVPAEWSLFPH